MNGKIPAVWDQPFVPFGDRSGRPTKVILAYNSTQLFLFPKLDLLAKELRIASVFCQESNYGG